MAFWTDPNFQPAQQNRFRLRFISIDYKNQYDAYLKDLEAWKQLEPKRAPTKTELKGWQMMKPIIPTDIWWWTKSCTLPGFEIGMTEYQLVNQKFKYPGMLVWNDITIQLVETGQVAKQILSILGQTGYACPGKVASDGCVSSGIQKGKFTAQGDLMIQQIDANGKTTQEWWLNNWFIKSARFGDLNYETDDFVAVELIIGYDCATNEK